MIGTTTLVGAQTAMPGLGGSLKVYAGLDFLWYSVRVSQPTRTANERTRGGARMPGVLNEYAHQDHNLLLSPRAMEGCTRNIYIYI